MFLFGLANLTKLSVGSAGVTYSFFPHTHFSPRKNEYILRFPPRKNEYILNFPPGNPSMC